jgi:hypothetical protein
MKPFDYVNSVTDNKKNIMIGTENDELAEKGYVPYLTNKSLSYHMDSILYANEMNQHPFLDNKLQYEYYLHGISKKKRFSKWTKKEDNEDIEIISQWYGCNYSKAAEILKIINKNTLDLIKQKLQKGGASK